MTPVLTEIGSCNAVLGGVRTLKDGSVKIELEINPEDQEIISKLLKAYVNNEKLLSIGIYSVKYGSPTQAHDRAAN